MHTCHLQTQHIHLFPLARFEHSNQKASTNSARQCVCACVMDRHRLPMYTLYEQTGVYVCVCEKGLRYKQIQFDRYSPSIVHGHGSAVCIERSNRLGLFELKFFCCVPRSKFHEPHRTLQIESLRSSFPILFYFSVGKVCPSFLWLFIFDHSLLFVAVGIKFVQRFESKWTENRKKEDTHTHSA